jgi:hypothetical protein
VPQKKEKEKETHLHKIFQQFITEICTDGVEDITCPHSSRA